MTNLIIIDCHDIGQHLGSYGWKTSPTKNLDALAARGIRFQNNFGTAPQCSPSRAGLYTGRYPHANGMFGLAHHPFNWRFHEDEKHLAQIMREAGYETHLIGIQHVTGFKTQLIEKLGFQNVCILKKPELVAEKVGIFLSEKPKSPFFLKIGFEYPHRDENGRFKQAPPDSSLGVEVPPYLPKSPEALEEMAEFQGVIKAMDEAFGQIWQSLTQSGLLKDTWVIFTTDHGIAMPRAKCTLYDPGIATALIMYAEPFNLVGGEVYDTLISNVDMVPTILDMLEIDKPDNLQGQSFANLLRHTDYQPRQEIFAEKTFHTAYEPQRAIRTGQYKLIWNVEAGIVNVPGDVMRSPIFPLMINEIVEERPYFELYDLKNDPQERINLIEDPEYSEIINDLRQRLFNLMKDTGDPLLEGPIPSPFFNKSREKLDKNSA